MKSERYLPSAVLRPFIKTFTIIESDNGMENRILPDTSLVMAFRFRGNIKVAEQGIESQLPSSVITGIRRSTRLVGYSKEASTLLVIFHEGGAAPFFKQPLHELFGMSVSLDDIIHRSNVSEIEERLAEAKNNEQRIFIVEQFLLRQLKKPQQDLLIQSAVRQIKAVNGDLRIADLLEDLPVSRDPFEKRFRRMIGTSPKQFSVIVRLRNLIDHYSPTTNLTGIAHAAGYFDQAHFIKDFKLFTGQTPQEFFKSPVYW